MQENPNGGRRPPIRRAADPGRTSSRRGEAGRSYAQEQAAARRRAHEAEQARRREAEKRRRQAERRRAWRVFWGRALAFLIIFLCLAAIAGIGFALYFHADHAEKEPTGLRYTYGGAEGAALDDALAVQDGVLYVDFTETASYLGLAQVGGAVQMRFVIPRDTTADSAGDGSEEEVIFYAGQDLALVNGQNVRLERCAVLNGEHYLVPASFLTEYMEGVSVTRRGSLVEIARTYTDETPDTVQFVLKQTDAADRVTEDASIGEIDPDAVIIPPVTVPDETTGETTVETTPPDTSAEIDLTVEFQSDLSAYEEYMNPADRDAYLILVNADHTIGEDYLPDDLTDVTDTRKDGRNTQKMVKTAAMALEAMYIEMRAAGYTDVSVTSAYRSYSYQNYLFNLYTENEMAANPSLSRAQAEAITLTYSCRPGTSEHQTGLCCDMHNLGSADQAFAKKEAYAWLQENAWKFGFILRFPEGKEEITKISFEPWHYRFVGRYHAKAMHDAGLCLEEYLDTLG